MHAPKIFDAGNSEECTNWIEPNFVMKLTKTKETADNDDDDDVDDAQVKAEAFI